MALTGMRKPIFAKLAQLLVAAILGCAAQAGAPEEIRPRRVPVRLVEVRASPAPRWLPGTVSASSRALVSTRISAAVARVLVREGDRVSRGDVLVRLVDGDVRAQLAAARVVLQTAEASERRARTLS